MRPLRLYDHATSITVQLDQGPVTLCVSRVPQRHGASPRGRMLLLHGNPANMHDFEALAAHLGARLDVLAIDLPGFGRSGNVRRVRHETVLHSYARHVQAAVDALGWHEPYYLLGHSHGAAVAQSMAALFPERISRLVLLGSVGTPAHWGYRQLRVPGVMSGLRLLARALELPNPRPVRKRLVRAIMTPIFAPSPLAEEWIDTQLAVVDARPEVLVNMALVATGDPCAQLARTAASIRAPTLFVHGDSDRLVPVRYARGIYEIVSRRCPSEFHVLPNTGHMLQISHPESVSRLALDWLERVEGAERPRLFE